MREPNRASGPWRLPRCGIHTQWSYTSLSWPDDCEHVANKDCWRHHPALAGSFARQWTVVMRHLGLCQWGRARILPAMVSNDWPPDCYNVSPNLPSVGAAKRSQVTQHPPTRSTERHDSLNACGLAQTANSIDSCCCPPPSSSTAIRMHSS